MAKKVKKVFFIILLLVPLFVLGAFWYAGNLLSATVNQTIGSCPNDLICESIEFQSESGSLIKGWFLKGEQEKGVVILMHGLRGNRLGLVDRIRFLNKSGYAVLAFDFQGSGESIGEKLTFGYLESRDATAAINFIKTKLPHEKIGVVGISMGGAAFLLEKEQPKIDALILEMVYPTIQRAVENRLNLWLFNGADVLAPLMTWQFPMRLGVSAEELRPLDKMPNVKIPVQFIVGENDHHTTLEESKQLFEAANQPKEMWIVPKAEHGDLYKVSPKDYEQKMLQFFDKTLRGEKQ